MHRYLPLNPAQRQAIQRLAFFFDPATAKIKADEASQPLLNTNTDIPSQYNKATNQLSCQQKANLNKYEEKIQRGFDNYSAY